MSGKGTHLARLTAITSALAWVLANAFDVLSALFLVQVGQSVFAGPHRAENWLIYAGIRLLATLAVGLLAAHIGQRWPRLASWAWGALSVSALATAGLAWWRVSG